MIRLSLSKNIYNTLHYTYFSLFCELNFMNEFLYLASSSNNRDINLQIIKSFATLILTLNNKISLYYIFSNNFINQIISNHFEQYDEDFLSYYVNFLKSLTLKIDLTTIRFFFNDKFNSFPLLENALKLYNHNDSMIKNVVRNIYLSFCKINYPPILDYLCSLPSINYLVFIACRLKSLSFKLNEILIAFEKGVLNDYAELKSFHDDMIDEILYLQDIYSLNYERINDILTNTLLYYWILPLLCDSIILNRNNNTTTKKKYISPQLALYLIALVIKCVKNEKLLNAIVYIMFNKKINDLLIVQYVFDEPKTPMNYYFEWSEQKKHLNISLKEFIMTNFSVKWAQSLIYQKSSSYKEIRELADEYTKHFEEDGEYNPDTPQNTKEIIDDILCLIESEINVCNDYHSDISRACGVDVGIAKDKKEESVLGVICKCEVSSLNQGEVVSDNIIRENLFGNIMKGRSEICIMLVNVLLNQILKKEEISKELLNKCFIYNVHESKNLFNDNTSNNKANSNNNKTATTFVQDLLDIFGGNKSKAETETKTEEVTTNDNTNVIIVNDNSILFNFDNKFLSTKYPIKNINFDIELLETFLNLLIEKPYSSLLTLLTISNFTLLYLTTNQNILSPLMSSQIESIGKIYYSYLSNIHLTLISNQVIAAISYEHFEKQWLMYSENVSSKVDKLLQTPFLFIDPTHHERIEDFPFKPMTTIQNIFSNNLLAFMALYDLCKKIKATQVDLLGIDSEDNEIGKSGYIKNAFPNEISNGNFIYEDDHILNLSEGSFDKTLYKCQAKKSMVSRYSDYLLFIEMNYVFFATSLDEFNKQIKIKMKYPLRVVEIFADKTPMKLNLSVNDKGKYIDYDMLFDSDNMKNEVRKVIETSRKEVRQWEKEQILNYFSNLINTYKSQ